MSILQSRFIFLQDLLKIIIYVGVLIFLLVVFILGDSYLLFWLIGIGSWSLLFWFVFQIIQGKKIIKKADWSILCSWIFLLLVLLLSTVVTHSVSISLRNFTLWLFSFAWFFSLVYTLPKNIHFDHLHIDVSELVAVSLTMIGMVLTVMSLLFLFVPIWSSLLPGMNILFATYGHNHLSAYLILILPLTWWLALRKKNMVLLFVPIFFTVGLLISFGRVAILIGMVQLIFIYLEYKGSFLAFQKSRTTSFNKQLFFIVGLLVSIFLLVLTVKAYFSISFLLKNDFVCPVQIYEKQLCKPINKESRFEYWHQAWLGLKNNLLLGYGPGTFSLLSLKYRLTPYAITSYAHNAFFQQFAETGLLGGGMFIILMGLLLLKAYKISRRSKLFSLERMFFLGIATIYFDSFFDFDWSFFGIWLVTLLLLALLCQQQISELREFTNNKKAVFLILAFVLISIVNGIAFGTIYSISEFYLRKHEISKAFDFFPYFLSHMEFFLMSDQLDKGQKATLLEIHKYNPEIYVRYLSSNKVSQDEKFILQKQLFSIDPLQQTLSNYNYSWLLEQQRYQEAETAIKDSLVFENKLIQTTGHGFSDQQRQNNSTFLLTIANHYVETGEYQKAAELFLYVYQYDKNAVKNNASLVLSPEVSTVEGINFYRQIASIKGDQLGNVRYPLFLDYLDKLLVLLQKQDTTDFPIGQDVNNLMNIAQGQENEIWTQVSNILKQRILDSNYTDATAVMLWFEMWKSAEGYHNNLDLSDRYFLTKALIQTANTMFSSYEENGNTICQTQSDCEELGKSLAQLYIAAYLIEPRVFEDPSFSWWYQIIKNTKNNEKFFEKITVWFSKKNYSVSLLQGYVEVFVDNSNLLAHWNQADQANFFAALVFALVHQGKVSEANQIADLFLLVEPDKNYLKQELLQQIQIESNNIFDSDIEKAESYLQVMNHIAPDNYAVATEFAYINFIKLNRLLTQEADYKLNSVKGIGNYFQRQLVLRKTRRLALKRVIACQKYFKENLHFIHIDCKDGQEEFKKGNLVDLEERYWDMSKVISGTTTWDSLQ